MSERIPQSVAYLVVFRAYLASDGKTPATGKTIAITISKNGGAFGNPNAGATNATEISSGFYKFTLDTTDTGTQGPLAWRGAQADINDAGDALSVVDPATGGLSNLDAAISSRMATYTQPTGFLAATFPAGTIANTTNITAGTITTTTNLTNLPAITAGWLTTAGIAANAINASKLDPDVTTELQAGLATSSALAAVAAQLPAALTSNGNLKVSLQEILTTAVTEGAAGRLAGGFVKWFNVASPTGTVNSIPDAVAGASNGLLRNGANLGAITLASVEISGAFNILDGLYITRATSGIAFTCQGQGVDGHGAAFFSGADATGNGLQLESFATNGYGLNVIGTGDGAGAQFAGGNEGIFCNGTAAAIGLGPFGLVGNMTGNITGNLVGTVSTLTTYTGNTPQTGDVFPLVSTEIADIKAKTDLIPASPAAVGSAMTLAAGAITTASIADGAITDAKFTLPAVTGVATGFMGMVHQLWRRFFKKAVKDDDDIKTYADNGTTVLTTQVISTVGSTETQGPAT